MASRTPTESRSEETRQRLLRAAIDVFGRLGFEAATTRQIAQKAGVNLQAIPYHFGGKEGLYLACAEYLATQLQSRLGQVAARLRESVQEGPPSKATARRLLTELLQTMATTMLSKESEPWARFIVREQMDPSAAFEHLYGQVMAPMFALVRKLLAVLLADDPASDRVALRAFALFGQVIALRAARAAVLRELRWKHVGPEELATIHEAIAASIAAIRPGGTP